MMTPVGPQYYREERLAAPLVGGEGGVLTARWNAASSWSGSKLGSCRARKPVVGIQLDRSLQMAHRGTRLPACRPSHGQHVLHLVAVGFLCHGRFQVLQRFILGAGVEREGGGKDLLLERLRRRWRFRPPLTHLQVQS